MRLPALESQAAPCRSSSLPVAGTSFQESNRHCPCDRRSTGVIDADRTAVSCSDSSGQSMIPPTSAITMNYMSCGVDQPAVPILSIVSLSYSNTIAVLGANQSSPLFTCKGVRGSLLDQLGSRRQQGGERGDHHRFSHSEGPDGERESVGRLAVHWWASHSVLPAGKGRQPAFSNTRRPDLHIQIVLKRRLVLPQGT